MSESSFDYEEFIKRQGELRNKIEVVKERIGLAKTEERKAYYRSCLKHSWPRAETVIPPLPP